MNKEEFLVYVNKTLAPESGLRPLTQADVKILEEYNFIRPPYCKEHVHPAVGFLKCEKEVYDKQEKSGEYSQYHWRFIEVLSCDLGNPDEENLVYETLVEQGVSWWDLLNMLAGKPEQSATLRE